MVKRSLSFRCCVVLVLLVLTSTMKEQIAPLSIISASFMIPSFLFISAHCAPSFAVSLSLSHAQIHTAGERSPMLHCSTALHFSVYPAVHGIRPQAWQLLHSSVCVCCPSLWTVGQHKSSSSDRHLSDTHKHTHAHSCTVCPVASTACLLASPMFFKCSWHFRSPRTMHCFFFHHFYTKRYWRAQILIQIKKRKNETPNLVCLKLFSPFLSCHLKEVLSIIFSNSYQSSKFVSTIKYSSSRLWSSSYSLGFSTKSLNFFWFFYSFIGLKV